MTRWWRKSGTPTFRRLREAAKPCEPSVISQPMQSDWQAAKATCVSLGRAAQVVSKILAGTETAVGQADLFPYLAEVGLPAAPMRRVRSKAEAEQAARDLGPRVVMKIDTARVVHKSDVGGVALGVTAETAARTYDHLLALSTHR